VRLWNTTGNVFTRNYIGNNTNYSFYIESSDIQVYLNNFFDNENSVYSDSNSWWNSTEMLIYEFNGSMFRNHLGNYWSDYNGSDSDSDGVGDVPYNVNTSIPEKDFYPLTHFMENFTPISIPDLTVGDITIPKMEPGKNSVITVMISNTGTGNATTNVSLKVENNTIENKTLQLNAGQAINLTFNWIPPGSGAYSIEVEVDPDDSVSEFNETNNNVSTIVTVSSPPSGSSQPASGGGGGGGGALTLKPSFIAPYEYYESFVRSFRVNETVVIVIPAKLEEDTGISEIGASIDKIMLGTAAISKVRSLPEDMPAPEGNVFAYFEFVCTQYGTLNKVEPSGYLKFRVLKEWLRSVEAGQSDVKLLKYADKWIEIPVELTGEDENYHYFKANLESFSIFSIVAEVKAVTITPTSTPMQVKTEAPEPIETLESLSTEITTPAPAFSTEMIVTIAVIMSATAVLLYVARRK
jgi:PGF-pre-PGF domain-containing protein